MQEPVNNVSGFPWRRRSLLEQPRNKLWLKRSRRQLSQKVIQAKLAVTTETILSASSTYLRSKHNGYSYNKTVYCSVLRMVDRSSADETGNISRFDLCNSLHKMNGGRAQTLQLSNIYPQQVNIHFVPAPYCKRIQAKTVDWLVGTPAYFEGGYLWELNGSYVPATLIEILHICGSRIYYNTNWRWFKCLNLIQLPIGFRNLRRSALDLQSFHINL